MSDSDLDLSLIRKSYALNPGKEQKLPLTLTQGPCPCTTTMEGCLCFKDHTWAQDIVCHLVGPLHESPIHPPPPQAPPSPPQALGLTPPSHTQVPHNSPPPPRGMGLCATLELKISYVTLWDHCMSHPSTHHPPKPHQVPHKHLGSHTLTSKRKSYCPLLSYLSLRVWGLMLQDRS